jgi:hypothetical protein
MWAILAAVAVLATVIGVIVATNSNPQKPIGGTTTGNGAGADQGDGPPPPPISSSSPQPCVSSQLTGTLSADSPGVVTLHIDNPGAGCTLPAPVTIVLLDNNGPIGQLSFGSPPDSVDVPYGHETVLHADLKPCNDGTPAAASDAKGDADFSRVSVSNGVQACTLPQASSS